VVGNDGGSSTFCWMPNHQSPLRENRHVKMAPRIALKRARQEPDRLAARRAGDVRHALVTVLVSQRDLNGVTRLQLRITGDSARAPRLEHARIVSLGQHKGSSRATTLSSVRTQRTSAANSGHVTGVFVH
jgi:hypothetical protein